MIYKPFSIVTVPFPFTDKNQIKRRPALVLSSTKHQEETNHITLLMITSAKNSAWSDDYLISSLKETGLSAASIVRQKLFTVDSRLILQSIGKLSNHDQQEVKKKIAHHLSI